MADLNVDSIGDASGGNTATINSYTPTESNMAGRNRIINGDMRISQRGSVNVSPGGGITYTAADRFSEFNYFGTGQINTSISTEAPAGFSNSLLLSVATAVPLSGTTGYYAQLSQSIEGLNIADVYSKKVTLSFWVRSSVTGVYSVMFPNINPLGITSGTRLYVAEYTISSANTWEQKTITVDLSVGSSSGTWVSNNTAGLSVNFNLGAESNRKGDTYLNTWGTLTGVYEFQSASQVQWASTSGATFYITGVQLEAGSVATPFERRQYGQELALCQRYYYRIRGSDTGLNTGPYGYGFSQGTTVGRAVINFPVTMRSIPSALEQSGTANHYRVILGSSGSTDCSAVPSYTSASVSMADIFWTVASGATANQGILFMSNNASSYLAWSAEL